MLYQSILEAASSASERNVVCARIFDAAQHALGASIRTCWRRPKSIKARQEPVALRAGYFRRGEPDGTQVLSQGRGGVLDCHIDCDVGVVLRIVVADDPDPNHMPLFPGSYRLRANKWALGGEEQLPISSPDGDQDPGCAQPWYVYVIGRGPGR